MATIALSAFVKLFETNLGLQPAQRPREIALAPRRLIVAQRDGTRLLLNAGEVRLRHRTHTRMHNSSRPTQPSPAPTPPHTAYHRLPPPHRHTHPSAAPSLARRPRNPAGATRMVAQEILVQPECTQRAQIASELRLALPEWEIELLTFGRMPLAEQVGTRRLTTDGHGGECATDRLRRCTRRAGGWERPTVPNKGSGLLRGYCRWRTCPTPRSWSVSTAPISAIWYPAGRRLRVHDR